MTKPIWPEGKQCAIMVTLNLDAEYFWLALSEDVVNRPKTMSMGQYGMKRGLDRVLAALDARGIKATCFVPGLAAKTYEAQIKQLHEQGHEIACHGLKHENFALMSGEEQKAALTEATEIISSITGKKPIGFRAPEGELTLETLSIAKELGYVYSSNLSNDDRPYFLDLPGGDKMLEIPIQWELFDLPYFAFNYRPAFPAGQGRPANYTQVLRNWQMCYEGYHKRGLCYVLQLDPQTIGSPGRIGMLEELLDQICAGNDAWFATGEEMAKYYGVEL